MHFVCKSAVTLLYFLYRSILVVSTIVTRDLDQRMTSSYFIAQRTDEVMAQRSSSIACSLLISLVISLHDLYILLAGHHYVYLRTLYTVQ
jgi:hypothetical protein